REASVAGQLRTDDGHDSPCPHAWLTRKNLGPADQVSPHSRRTLARSTLTDSSRRRIMPTCFLLRSFGPCPGTVTLQLPRTNSLWLVFPAGLCARWFRGSHFSRSILVMVPLVPRLRAALVSAKPARTSLARCGTPI